MHFLPNCLVQCLTFLHHHQSEVHAREVGLQVDILLLVALLRMLLADFLNQSIH